jgi:photosystem II stability/assembly factor-like uncharacterized protein
MKKIIFTLVAILFLGSSFLHSQTGWFLQTSPTNKNLLDIYFVNSQTGWACGDSGRIIKTTNGGTVWTELTPFTSNKLNVIRFLDANFGYVAGGSQTQYPMCIDNDILARTTNGGGTWTTLLSNSSWDIFYDLALVNKDTIFATYAGTDQYCMANSGGAYQTYNTGSNWSYFTGGWVKGITFLNQSTGWLSSFGMGDVMRGLFSVYKTTNTGVNWNPIYVDTLYGASTIGKMKFLDVNNGFCLYRMLRKTTNGGVNWQKIDSVNTYNLRSFALANKDTLWIARGYNILRTNNSGANWTQQLTTGVPINTVYFFDKNTGWIAANSGIIYKTITGGITGIQNISSEVPSAYSLSQNYPNPFNPTTKIRFSIVSSPHVLGGDLVLLKVYDVQGREVQTLVNETLQPGTYEASFDGSMLNSGVYFYKMVTGNFSETKKMLLIK